MSRARIRSAFEKLPHCKYFPPFAILSPALNPHFDNKKPGVVRGASSNFEAWFWYDGPSRPVVGRTPFHSSRSFGLHRLCDVGGLSRQQLLLWKLPFSVLFP